MKKVITMIGILVIASALLCACTTNGELGEHNFSSKWYFNAAEHFHRCRDCDEVADNATHTFKNGKCTVCGYKRKPSEGLEFSLNMDGISYSAAGIGTCKDVDLVIPDTYEDYPVTTIGEDAFYNCESLQSVSIGDSVTTIGEGAFYNCTSLKSIALPEGVTTIGEGAFFNCTSLKSVVLPNSVTNLDVGAFCKCSGLQRIAFGESLTNIGEMAFNSCESLKSVVLPESVTSIGRGAFFYCTSLQSAEVPGCVLGDYVFNKCYKMRHVAIGEGVTAIGEGTFSGTILQSVVIPDSVTTIGEGAFAFCSCLQSAVIGAGVTSIANRAFDGCYKLIEVCNNSSLGIFCGSDENGEVGLCAKNIYSDIWNESKIVDYQGYSFYVDGEEIFLLGYNGDETSITLPESFDGSDYEIYRYAFAYSDNMHSVVIPDSVTNIGESSFYYCEGLQSVSIGSGVTGIGESAFAYSDDLQSVSIGSGVTGIGSYAFYRCTSLQSVVIGAGVTKIGFSAFEWCNKLIEVCNNSSLDIRPGSEDNGYVGFYAKNIYRDEEGESKLVDYQGCSFYVDGEEIYLLGYNGDETSITLPESFDGRNYEIYQYVFYNCDSLQSVVIGKGVTSIGRGAFADCDYIQSVYYHGTEDGWEQIDIGFSNYLLTGATRYYYSESDPTKSADYNEENNYWHYGENGEIAVWEKTPA